MIESTRLNPPAVLLFKLKQVCGMSAADLGVLLMSAPLSSAVACAVPVGAPLPLIGGPYGILAAGAAYGGFLLFKRLKNHR
jgi:hypothetical protein